MPLDAGDLYYNGFYFPSAIHARVFQEPVADKTGRYEKYQRLNIVVEFMVYPGADDAQTTRTNPETGGNYSPFFPTGGNTDTGAQSLRRVLSAYGKRLIFSNKGMGSDLSFSSAPGSTSSFTDVMYGPKPRVLAWEFVGGNKGLRIVWEVEVNFADCSIGGRRAEFNFETTWNIDNTGHTQRVINGQLEILVPRVGSTGTTSADVDRTSLNFPVPAGFQRDQRYGLSPDRKFLTFTVTDNEIPSDNPYPNGIVAIEADHTIQSATTGPLAIAGSLWRGTISAAITVGAGRPRWWMWLAFVNIIKSRREELSKGRITQENGDTQKSTGMIIHSLSVTEKIFGRSMAFSLSYTMVANLETVLAANGIWKPVGINTWAKHATSLTWPGGGPWSHRGWAQMFHNPANDTFISICGEQTTGSGGAGSLRQQSDRQYALLKDDCKPFYMSFRPKADLVEDSNTVAHYPLGGSPSPPSPRFTTASTGSGLAASSSKAPIIHHRTQSYWTVLFTGTAVRKGAPIPRNISLVSYGGVGATLVGKLHFEQEIVSTLDGCPVYAARWRGTYSLSQPPKGALLVTEPSHTLVPQ